MRLIPAHAGKTGSGGPRSRRGAAHPRSRGENELRELIGFSDQGSSPLTRGKHHLDCPAHHELRLIPAHAGKTDRGRQFCPRAAAHPRSRGENFADLVHEISHLGSSPLTRGKLCPSNLAGHECRLIPAHAGKTPRSAAAALSRSAHPRSRGENILFGVGANGMSGSSPLTRGKLVSLETLDPTRGLIPAHAGKTRHASASPLEFSGSSPLTRGKRDAGGWAAWRARLIPAHAGKTPTGVLGPSSCRAHPRSRGENPFQRCPLHRLTGSSPLTRGKR